MILRSIVAVVRNAIGTISTWSKVHNPMRVGRSMLGRWIYEFKSSSYTRCPHRICHRRLRNCNPRTLACTDGKQHRTSGCRFNHVSRTRHPCDDFSVSRIRFAKSADDNDSWISHHSCNGWSISFGFGNRTSTDKCCHRNCIRVSCCGLERAQTRSS